MQTFVPTLSRVESQIEVRYASAGWQKWLQEGKAHTDKQEVWQQLDEDTWLRAQLIRFTPDAIHPPVVSVEEAWLIRGHQPNGNFRNSSYLADHHRALRLVPDDRVRNTTPPEPPKPADTAGANYIRSQNYAVPGKETA